MSALTWENELIDLSTLELHARLAEVATWHGRHALQLDGLALVPAPEVLDGRIEVEIGADGACYAGVAFGASDALNHELAYASPHCSGLIDAVQYDPVFHASNTWQLYHGRAYQQSVPVPTGEWFQLRIDLQDGRAAVQLNDLPPLQIEQLVHPRLPGRVGVWTYKPACFRALRVISRAVLPPALPGVQHPSGGAVSEWFVEGFGRVRCEPTGILNLNRYLPVALGEVRLVRSFDLAAPAEVELSFGFSDELSLAVDGQEHFAGTNTFKGFASYEERGYAYSGAHTLSVRLDGGRHQLTARLKVTEYFGWGIVLSARAEGLRWLPATSGVAT